MGFVPQIVATTVFLRDHFRAHDQYGASLPYFSKRRAAEPFASQIEFERMTAELFLQRKGFLSTFPPPRQQLLWRGGVSAGPTRSASGNSVFPSPEAFFFLLSKIKVSRGIAESPLLYRGDTPPRGRCTLSLLNRYPPPPVMALARYSSAILTRILRVEGAPHRPPSSP